METQNEHRSELIEKHFTDEFVKSLPPFMTMQDIAVLSGVPVGTQKFFRNRGHGGPKMFSISARNIRATREDVLAWLAERIEAAQDGAAA